MRIHFDLWYVWIKGEERRGEERRGEGVGDLPFFCLDLFLGGRERGSERLAKILYHLKTPPFFYFPLSGGARGKRILILINCFVLPFLSLTHNQT
jgi:hypothetical protein